MSCPWHDTILAVFLDGDLVPGQGEEAARHRNDCDDCQLALRQARRLDAALASNAGRELDDPAVEPLRAPALGARVPPEPSMVWMATIILA